MTEIPVITPDSTVTDQSGYKANLYSNGAKHLYEVDAEGNHKHIGIDHDAIIGEYGYDPNMDRNAPINPEDQAKLDTAEKLGGSAVEGAVPEPKPPAAEADASQEPLKFGDSVKVFLNDKPADGWKFDRYSDDGNNAIVYKDAYEEGETSMAIEKQLFNNWQQNSEAAAEETLKDPEVSFKIGDVVQVFIDKSSRDHFKGKSEFSPGWTVEEVQDGTDSTGKPDKIVLLSKDGKPYGQWVSFGRLKNWQAYKPPEESEPDDKTSDAEKDKPLSYEELMAEVQKLRKEIEELKAGKKPEQETKEPLKVGDEVRAYLDHSHPLLEGTLSHSGASEGWKIEAIADEQTDNEDGRKDRLVTISTEKDGQRYELKVPLALLENWQKSKQNAPGEQGKQTDDGQGGNQTEQAPKGPSPEELEAAEAALVAARDKLVELDIKRSARTGDGLTQDRKDTGEAYKAAMEEYREALAALGLLKVAEMRAENKTDAEIRQSLIQARYQESRTYAQRVFDRNNELLDEEEKNGGFLKKNKAKLLRRWSNYSTKKKILIGLAVGGGVSLASALSGGGLFLLAAGSASRFSMGLLNRKASLRNVSKHSLERELKAIDAAEAGHRDGADVLLSGEDRVGSDAEAVTSGISHKTEKNQRKNRVGAALMVGGGVMAAAGIVHAESLDIPGVRWPFGHGGGHNGAPIPVNPDQGHVGGGELSGVDWSTFHPNSFQGSTPHEAVRSMFTDVLQKGNHLQVKGLTDDKIEAITRDMQAGHWHIASGMGADGHQHIVDVSKDWADGQTSNADASRLQGLREVNGSTVQSWRQFARLAAKHGVTISQERAAA